MAVAADLRATIARAKRRDLMFVGLGVAALLFAACTFVALFIDMIGTGFDRLNPDLFTEFGSRRAERAGILAAWVGSFAVMMVTALFAVPLGVAAGTLGSGSAAGSAEAVRPMRNSTLQS